MKRLLPMFVVMLLLTGCSMGNTTQSMVEPEPTTLTLMLPQTHYKDFFKQQLADFEAEYPAIRISAQVIPDNQWLDLVKRKIAVSETPDMIRIDRGLIMDVGTEHFVEFDASEAWYDRVLPEQLENKLIDGKLYGLPINANSSVGIAYNKQLFDAHGLTAPYDMASFAAVCDYFKNNTDIIPLYASDKDSWTAQIAFDAAAPQAVDAAVWERIKQNELRWSDVPAFAEILSTFAALRAQGYTNTDYLTATYASAVTAMAGGNVAMYITGHFFFHDVHELNAQMDMGMIPVPYKGDLLTLVAGPGQLSILQDSPHIEEARQFISWLSRADNMDVFNAGWNHMPVFKDQQLVMSDWQQNLYDRYISKGKTVTEVVNIMSGIDLSDFWTYQQEMLTGSLTAEEALLKWDESFARQMREKGAWE